MNISISDWRIMIYYITQDKENCLNASLLINFIKNNKPRGMYNRKINDLWKFMFDMDAFDKDDESIKEILKKSLNEKWINKIYRQKKEMPLSSLFGEIHDKLSPILKNLDDYSIEGDIYSITILNGMALIELTDDINGKRKLNVTMSQSKLQDISVNMRVRITGRLTEYIDGGIIELNGYEISRVYENGFIKPTRAELQRIHWDVDFYTASDNGTIDFEIQTIGIISTSEKGAGFRDFVGVLKERGRNISFVYRFHPFTADNIIESIYDLQDKCECICIVRGGTTNSFYDFIELDNPELAEVVISSVTPVLTGIGNIYDNPVCCRVSYINGSTPTDLAYRVLRALTPYEARKKLSSSKGLLATFFDKIAVILGWK